MKKISIGVILIALSSQLYPQEYNPFPKSNAIYHTAGDNCFNDSIWSFKYAIYGDTIINSLTYSKVYEMYDTTLLHPKSNYFAAVRENDSKQVFVLFPWFDEFILYDFNLEVGDTIWYELGGGLCYNNMFFEPITHYKVVDEIDTILLENGEYRKSWSLLGGIEKSTWVEGIGSIYWYGLFDPLISYIYLCGDDYQFACFKQNDTVLYLNNPFCENCFCNFTSSGVTTGIPPTNILTVFPNPTKGVISVRINSNYSSNYKLSITYNTGLKIIEKNIRANQEIELDLGNYARGLYLVQVFDENGKLLETQKVVVE
ncbi:MAG: T9SS type A sorting domain-containing protein [Bacteroidales bacterium]|nr:T9SS type A sorting domain-containing protein [Bacteroidales bacterium]MDD4671945.1 T9SS type A sorting domain-containing protein [Bacteroidales bacterium]